MEYKKTYVVKIKTCFPDFFHRQYEDLLFVTKKIGDYCEIYDPETFITYFNLYFTDESKTLFENLSADEKRGFRTIEAFKLALSNAYYRH